MVPSVEQPLNIGSSMIQQLWLLIEKCPLVLIISISINIVVYHGVLGRF